MFEQSVISVIGKAKQEDRGVLAGVYATANVLIDPRSAAHQMRAPFAWAWPILTLSVVVVVFGYLMLPFTKELVDARLAAAGQTNIEQASATASTAATIGVFISPLLAIGIIALVAWLISGIANVFNREVSFRNIFTLAAGCSLAGSFQYIASYIVLVSKGEQIHTPEQLRPPFGPDIFLPELHGVALAFVGFFSVFEIWYLVVFTLGVAALARCSKAQGLALITPAWIIPLSLSVLGAAMQR